MSKKCSYNKRSDWIAVRSAKQTRYALSHATTKKQADMKCQHNHSIDNCVNCDAQINGLVDAAQQRRLFAHDIKRLNDRQRTNLGLLLTAALVYRTAVPAAPSPEDILASTAAVNDVVPTDDMVEPDFPPERATKAKGKK